MANIGAFGPVAFETSHKLVRNFDRLQETRRARYAQHDVLSLDSKLQWLGTGLAEGTLPMKFHSSFSDPTAEREKLKAMLEEHVAHPLVIGGVNLGNFVIEEMGATWDFVTNKGVLLHLTVECKLKEYH
jgi:phage protein U